MAHTIHPDLAEQIESATKRHYPDSEVDQKRAQGQLRRLFRVLDVSDGQLGNYLTEVHFRRYLRHSDKRPQSNHSDIALFRGLATTVAGARLSLRRPTKPKPVRPIPTLDDVRAAATRLTETRDSAGAAALVSVLADVRVEDFHEVTSTRHLIDRQLNMPRQFRRVSEELLEALPHADVGKVTFSAWKRARRVELEGRPDLNPVMLRTLANELRAQELGISVADMLRHGMIYPITRADGLSPQTTEAFDWCHLLGQLPMTERLLEEIEHTERGAKLASRPPSRTAARKRARELAKEFENPHPLRPIYKEWLDGYAPEAADVAPHWQEVSDPVIDVVSRVQHVLSLRSFKRLTGTVAKAFANAAANNRSLDPASVLSEQNINWHVAQMRGTDQTLATYRSDLRRAAKAWPGTGLVQRPIQRPHKKSETPYSRTNINTLTRIVTEQTDTDNGTRAERTKLFFGLGIGAGIRSSEIRRLHRSCFRRVDELLVIDVPEVGQAARRTVPVLPEWAHFVEQGIESKDGALTESEHKNHVGQTYVRIDTGSKHPPITQVRLRNTWLVMMMGSPDVSLATLLEVAGLRSARTLEDLVEFVPQDKPYDLLVDRARPGSNER